MDLPLNPFKRALGAGELQLGLWCSFAHHATVEVLAGSGFDWLLLDTEHTTGDLAIVHTQLQALMGSHAHPIVRPPWNDTVVIKRYLDLGVQSLLIPFIETEEEARHAVAATRYPPRGVRGYASAARASGFGRIADYATRCEEELCVLLQVESLRGLENLERIAAVEGVDGIFIGPGDLSAALGHVGQPAHPAVLPVVEAAILRVLATGKAAGILTGSEALARRYIELGCRFVAVGSDVGMLARGTEALAARFRHTA